MVAGIGGQFAGRQEYGFGYRNADGFRQTVIEEFFVGAPPKGVVDHGGAGEGGVLKVSAVEGDVLGDAVDDDVVAGRLCLDDLVDTDGFGGDAGDVPTVNGFDKGHGEASFAAVEDTNFFVRGHILRFLDEREIVGKHLFPYGPVVIAVGADIEPVRDRFGGKEPAHPFVLSAADIAFGCSEDDAHFPKCGVGSAGDEVDGVVEIDIVVIVAVGEGPDVEDAAHREAIGGETGMAEGEIGGMVAAEAAAGQGDARVTGFVGCTGRDLFQNQLIVQGVLSGAFGGGNRFVVPGGGVEAVGAIDLDFSRFEELAGGLDEALVFILIVGSAGGGEEDHGVAGMTEHQHFEVPADGR